MANRYNLRDLLGMALLVAAPLLASAHEPAVISPDDREGIAFPGHETFLLSGGESTPSDIAILRLELPAKTFGAPPHVHQLEDEHFYVLAGEIEFLMGEATISASAGSLVVLPRGHLHGFWNLSEQPASMLLMVTPGKFASFFDDVVAKIRLEHPDNPKLVGAIIGEIAAKYQVEVQPDKIPASALTVLPK